LGTFFGEAKKVPRLSGETDKDHSQHRRWPNVSAVASANPARNFSPLFNVGQTNSLDYAEVPDFRPLHYAFLVSEAVFDTALARIRQAGIDFYADFRQQRPGPIGHQHRAAVRPSFGLGVTIGYASELSPPRTESDTIVILIETERLTLRELTAADAPFILELLNEPSFIANIADKNVRTLDDAVHYIATGPAASYHQHGYGLYRVALKDGDTPIGICGLVKRDYLDVADVGYALLERHFGQGYGYESAAAVRDWARTTLGLPHLLGITSPDNVASIRLLEKLGLRFVKLIRTPGSNEDTSLFSSAP